MISIHLPLRIIITICLIIAFLLILTIAYYRIRFDFIRNGNESIHKDKVVAFFHPNCASGGGGERVLWSAIQTLEKLRKDGWNVRVAIYTTDAYHEGYKRELLEHVSSRFRIRVSPSLPLSLVHLAVDDESSESSRSTPQRQSLIAQSIYSMKLAWQAMHKLTPHVYFDTTGCAFTFLVARVLAGCNVAAYVHYPTISTDMLSLVWERRPSYNNDSSITRNSFYTYLKLLYYILLAILYGLVGSLANLTLVNSSWTFGHISFLWRFAPKIQVVFPPCDTLDLEDLSLDAKRENIVLSIGQFRPEKDHKLQLQAFSIFLSRWNKCNPDKIGSDQAPKLVLVGSCRDHGDEIRVKELQDLVDQYSNLSSDSVHFVLNQPYPVLKAWLQTAKVGMHTMWNEHFGIGVVEMMAAGLITIAHNSGGPKSDIIVPLLQEQNGHPQRTGYLATSAEEYADAMEKAFGDGSVEHEKINMKMRVAARASSRSFSTEIFAQSFKDALISSEILR